jgi:hypothetical protein
MERRKREAKRVDEQFGRRKVAGLKGEIIRLKTG